MWRLPTTGSTTTAWIAPLGRSLQACSPRWWRRQRVVQVSTALLSLMQDLQLHRGLSCAVLDRQAGFEDELAAVGAKLQRSMHAFGEQVGERHPLFEDAAWGQLLARWDSLRGNWRDLDFHTNLSVHSDLVLAVVAVLRQIGEDNARALQGGCVQVLGEWPTMVEHLGLLRAIGINRLGHRDEPMELRLAALYRVHLHEARSTLASVADDFANPALIDAGWRVVDRAAQLRAAVPEDLDASGYYAEITGVIDGWYVATRGRLRQYADGC